eukprot:gene2911-13671_t
MESRNRSPGRLTASALYTGSPARDPVSLSHTHNLHQSQPQPQANVVRKELADLASMRSENDQKERLLSDLQKQVHELMPYK